MQVNRNEIKTGFLVILTLGALVALVLYIGAPGVFKALNTYYVCVDNAAGIKPGAPVNLAGRKVGQIIELHSPVPMKDRPDGKPGYEVLLTLRVEADAQIYKKCQARMVAYGLLSELVIDFTKGDESSGRATNGFRFIGEREAALSELAPQIIEKLEPLIISGRETLAELKSTVSNIGSITATGSEFNLALARFRTLGDNLVNLTNPDGTFTTSLNSSMSSLNRSLASIETFSSQLKGDDLQVTLGNFRTASVDLAAVVRNANGAVAQLNTTLDSVGPNLVATTKNASQLTDTLKRQPWRVIWPTTKTYPDETHSDVEIRRALPPAKKSRLN